METTYRTLQTIYDIVKDKPNPHTYQCTPRQIILRQLLEWDIILQHLNSLSEEDLVSIKKIENSVGISITEKGIEKAKSFLDNSSTRKTKSNDQNN
jgi:predicted transcriptional regulator